IFSSHPTPIGTSFDVTDVLQPISIQPIIPKQPELDCTVKSLKPNPLEFIDELSEHLFKEVLSSDQRQGSFNKAADKTPLNALANLKAQPSPLRSFDALDSIVSDLKTNLTCGAESNCTKLSDDDQMIEMSSTNDNNLISDGEIDSKDSPTTLKQDDVAIQQSSTNAADSVEKPLSNFHIEIDSITPSDIPPRIIMDDSPGLKIILHFAKDRPRDDISVIVITTTNHNSIAIRDYQFDASASKPCKLRLQAASDTNLPGILPFRPPTKDITQIIDLHRFSSYNSHNQIIRMDDSAHQISDLELMFERATSPSNLDPDLLAVDTIVKIVQNDKPLSAFAAQKIKEKINSSNSKVVLQSLDLLEECMAKCSNAFQGEVGKFKFLNELIKLVSPKHKGDKTPKVIQSKILDMLLIWTIQYPQEQKIKEVYEMLMKQGVVHEPPKSINRTEKTTHLPSDFDSIPQNLLLSTNPRDIQTANLMIKSVMEKNNRNAEIQLKRGLELKKAMDNASLLSDMLNNFKSNETTEDELVTIKELYASCENLIPTISRLAQDIQNNELLGEALKVNDCLLDITKRYKNVITRREAEWVGSSDVRQVASTTADLLSSKLSSPPTKAASTLDELNEIFSSHPTPIGTSFDVTDVLQPISIQPIIPKQPELDCTVKSLKPNPLEFIDELSEHLFKEVLSSDQRQGSFNKAADKTPLNALANLKAQPSPLRSFDALDSIVSDLKTNLTCGAESNCTKLSDDDQMIEMSSTNDNNLISDGEIDSKDSPTTLKQDDVAIQQSSTNAADSVEKPLSNFHIEIDSITPSDIPPRIIMDDSPGLKIILHFAKDRPRDDISVIVITTTNHNSIAIRDYQFDASASKNNRNAEIQLKRGLELKKAMDNASLLSDIHPTPIGTSFDVTDVLQPISIQPIIPKQPELDCTVKSLKPNPLEFIDELSEHLFKEVLSSDQRQGSFNKAADKTPLNALANLKAQPSPLRSFDALDSIPCKLRLQAASDTNLPGILPFRPPTKDITQIMLLSNKDRLATVWKTIQIPLRSPLRSQTYRITKNCIFTLNNNRNAEIQLKRGLELKKAMDNASLLSDMLNNFKSNETTEDELVTIKELYASCENLIPTISRLAQDIQNNELLGTFLVLCLRDRLMGNVLQVKR
ncbi:ADP-ribosylation factor-binding protein GGA1, partial [Pseudolycoriella hygida]